MIVLANEEGVLPPEEGGLRVEGELSRDVEATGCRCVPFEGVPAGEPRLELRWEVGILSLARAGIAADGRSTAIASEEAGPLAFCCSLTGYGVFGDGSRDVAVELGETVCAGLNDGRQVGQVRERTRLPSGNGSVALVIGATTRSSSRLSDGGLTRGKALLRRGGEG